MTDTIIKDIFFKQGDFVIITGPMFAGKSKLLIDLFYKQENVCAYGSVINTRDNSIKSRDYKDKEIPCQKIANPLDILKCDKEIVIIDEFQFLGPVESLKDIVNTLKEKKKIIIMAGLDLLANGAEWENYTVLKKICDKERTKKKQRKKERKEKRKPPAAKEITRVAKAANACSKGGGRQQCLTQ